MGKYSASALRPMFVPLLSLVLLIVFSIIGGQIILGRFAPLREQISTLSTTSEALEQKLSTLKQIDATVLDQTEFAYLSLPAANPGALVVSQIKKIAAENEIIIQSLGLSDGSSPDTEVNTAIINLKASGQHTKALAFVKELERLAPLINVERIKLEASLGGESELTAIVQSYWADFPETLPNIAEGVSALSEDEINILARLSELEKPSFSSLQPSSSSARPNPFSIDN